MKSFNIKNNSSGFTLLESLIVVGIIVILGGAVITGVNPVRQISNTRNAQRVSAVANIQGAINSYAIDTFGGYPEGIDNTIRMIGTAEIGCAVMCGPGFDQPIPPPPVRSFSDDTQGEFASGTNGNTEWSSANGTLRLNSTGLVNLTGGYISTIFDAGSMVTWDSLSWIPQAPYGKELPSPNTVSETGYPSGNAVMTGNVLLMHMNETSGKIADVSSFNNYGQTFGGVSYGFAGKFNTALTFNGSNGTVRVNSASNLNLPNSGGTVMLWIKPTVNLPQDTGMGLIRKPDYSGNLYSPGGYGMEIYRLAPNGPQNIKVHLGWNNGNSNSQQTVTGNVNITSGNWYHVAMTWNSGTVAIYVNGVLDKNSNRTSGLNWANGSEKLYIGHRAVSVSNGRAWYNGLMDEVALFSRQLTPQEILTAYQRGAMHPKLMVRSCDDAACANDPFVGPDGSNATYFSEETNTGTGPAPFTPNVPANQYFQYQLTLDTDTNLYGPEVTTVSGGNNGEPDGGSASAETELTADACLDLRPMLVTNHISEIPFDPQTGSAEKTYYAVKKMNRDNLVVRACSPELEVPIEVAQ